MRVLLVDDDAAIRRILGRILVSTFDVEVVEAENGVDGLAKLESDPPDLLIMDVNMPLLDGFGMLQAIRASPEHRNLPTVAVSAVNEREQIAQLIQLHITEYMLKPLELSSVTKRLGKVIQEIRSAPRRRRMAGEAAFGSALLNPSLLLIEPDPNFRQLFRSLFEGMYQIEEADTGPKGLKLAIEQKPSIVCVAQGLGLLSENLLAAYVRELATPPSAVYLLHAEATDVAPGLFDGLLKKSFVPELLAQRWAEVTGAGDPAQLLRDALAGSAQADVISATQQTLGVMTQQEVARLGDDQLDLIKNEVMPAMSLVTADGTLEVTIAMYGAKAHAERLAGLILGEAIAWDAGGNEAFSQLVETLGGRLRGCFATRGIRLEPQPVGFLPVDQYPATWAFRAGFESPSGERFVVGVGEPRKTV